MPASRWSRRPRGSRDLDISWHLGIDGISLFLLVMTGVLFPIAIIGAPAPTTTRSPSWPGSLLLEAGCLGVFLALDLFVFFVMFEIVLVPMYFLISGWAYANPPDAGDVVLLVHDVRLGLHARSG